jgi:hypothetical protein
MQTIGKYIDQYFDFLGEWELPSKCGLSIFDKDNKKVIIVTELYQDNPGTSVTYVSSSLAMQICEKFNINPAEIIYIESCPDMNSKLSFYKEKNYLVNFDFSDEKLSNPQYKELEEKEMNEFLKFKA